VPTPIPPALLNAFQAMAEIVYAGDSYESVYGSLCSAAVDLVDGCDHASLMLRRHGQVSTAASSDPVARRVDELETTLGEGPCLDAIDDDEPDEHICGDLTQGGCQWPALSEQIMAETPVRGMAGFRIRQGGQKVGALNVFSDTPGALTQESLAQALMLAAFASVTLAALESDEEASTLRRGLQSNREIGKAIGLLMAMHKIGDDEAFTMLSKVSQEMNIKVAEVAHQVIEHHRRTGHPLPPQ
jgi:GAF domain-containing protein